MIQVIFPKRQIIRELRKKVPVTGDGQGAWGFTTVPDGHEAVVYEVRLDFSALEAMARRAAASKGKRSRDGALEVRVIERHRVEEPK